MNPVVVLTGKTEKASSSNFDQTEFSSPSPQSILVATIDHEIRAALTSLLESAEIEAICVSSVKDAKTIISRKNISACLCGFWLQDGTYREVIRHLRRERMDIPGIIVSSPACPQDFREYLAAMNLGGLDVLAYPFQRSEFDRMLDFVVPSRSLPVSEQQPTREASQFEVGSATRSMLAV